jgi:hypothetical protein
MGRRGNKRRIPLDILLPTLAALLSISAFVIGDLAIEADRTSNPESYYTPPPEPEYVYMEEEAVSIDGWTEEGASTDMDFGRLPVNVTGFRVELTWQDDIGSNDVLAVALIFNDSELDSAEGGSGSLSLEIPEGNYNGTYGIKVTAVNCPGVVGISPIDRDTGNSWNLNVFLTVRHEV